MEEINRNFKDVTLKLQSNVDNRKISVTRKQSLAAKMLSNSSWQLFSQSSACRECSMKLWSSDALVYKNDTLTMEHAYKDVFLYIELATILSDKTATIKVLRFLMDVS